MATLVKKIYMKNSAGTQQTALIYSTTGESGTPNLPLKVDGVQGYVCLVGTSDTRATSGRVKTSAGAQYAIGTMGVPAYGKMLYTANSSFTVPAGVTVLRVTCVGGGAGGVASGYNGWAGTFTTTGAGGGSTSFGSVTAQGATAASETYKVTNAGEGVLKGQYISHVISYGYNNGERYTDANPHSGGAATPLVTIGGATAGAAGAGGMADLASYGTSQLSQRTCLTGASGYRTVSTISVTPGQVITATIGAGGAGRYLTQWIQGSKSEGGVSVSSGSPGAVLVEWGEGIQ